MRRWLLAGVLALATPALAGPPAWSPAERQVILSLAPAPAAPRDSTNRLSRTPAAIALGARLFRDPRLSGTGRTSCATCHQPDQAYSNAAAIMPRDDGTPQQRHAPSLLGVGQNRWFFWDGRRDTLWAQALEAWDSDMGGSPARFSALVAADPKIQHALSRLTEPSDPPEQVFVAAGKAIAAFVETLRPASSRFDAYLAALKVGRPTVPYTPIAAGLAVFLREGQCAVCHAGPRFTDEEFHSIRLSPLPGETAEDTGRFVGLYLLSSAHYSAASRFSDDPNGPRARLSAAQIKSRDLWGAFKTPSLLGVSRRPRFMHDGRFNTLADVIDHYSETPGAASVLHGDPPVPPLRLTPQQKRDLLAFLEAL